MEKELVTKRKEAAERIREWLEKSSGKLGPIEADLHLVFDRQRVREKTNGLLNFIVERKEVNETELFNKYHVGRKEMRNKTRYWSKMTTPVIVNFDSAKGIYTTADRPRKAEIVKK